jgi:hypothetical protein
MKRLTIFTLTFLFIFAMEVGADAKEPVQNLQSDQSVSETTEYRRHALSLELLGRGLLYSFDYDYLVTDDVAVGAGLSTYSFTSGDSDARVTFIPVYANYYFTPGEHRWFATAGVDLIHASGNVGQDEKVSGSGAAGILGAGYEYRGDSGFLFRAAPYLLVGKASGAWLGVSLGFSI